MISHECYGLIHLCYIYQLPRLKFQGSSSIHLPDSSTMIVTKDSPSSMPTPSQMISNGGAGMDEKSYQNTWPEQNQTIMPGGLTAYEATESLDEGSSTEEGSIHDVEEATTQRAPYSTFTKAEKNYIVFMAAWAGFFSQLATNIYLPAMNELASYYKVPHELINLTVTTYMIFQGLAPTLYGDLADMAGRRPAYIIGFVVFLGANIGLALQHSYAALLVLRCFQSSGSSGTIALGNGVVADITSNSERGIYMGLVMCGPMIGPAVGPVLGGIFAEFLGWRAIFWFLVIMAVVFLIPFVIAFPETARAIVGNGSIKPRGWNMSLINYLKTRKTRLANEAEAKAVEHGIKSQRRVNWPNPTKTLAIVAEKDAGLLLMYNALVYTAFYCVTTSTPVLFAKTYGFNSLQVGISYIPYGAGSICASFVCGKLMDYNYRRVARKVNFTINAKHGDDLRDFPIEKARIQVIYPMLFLGTATLLCYGWVMQVNAPLAAPLVLQFIIGLCLTGVFDIISTMLVDLYPSQPATATAANNLARCTLGAGGTALIIQMIEAMGRGWCFTFIALVVMVSSPMLLAVGMWGPQWREERRVRVEDRKVAEEKRKRVVREEMLKESRGE